MADARNRVETSTDFTFLCCFLNHRTIRDAVQIFLHNRCPIGRSHDMRVKHQGCVLFAKLYSPNFSPHEFSRESSSCP